MHNLTSFHSDFTLTNNKYFYCGNANGGLSLHSTGVTHRWTDPTDVDGKTLCITKIEPSVLKAQKDKADALAWAKTDYKSAFADMMAKVKGGLDSMLADSKAEYKSITDKRDAAKIILEAKKVTAAAADQAFASAVAAYNLEDTKCTTASNDAISALATKNAAASEFSTRNPVIQKELNTITSLLAMIQTLKEINLQETVNEDARASTSKSLHDTAILLATFNDDAGPLAEMVELAREHAEFTGPIIVLLKQLEAKLLAERATITTAASVASQASSTAATDATASCASKIGKQAEMTTAQTALASSIAGKNAANTEYNDLQALWVTATAECDAVETK